MVSTTTHYDQSTRSGTASPALRRRSSDQDAEHDYAPGGLPVRAHGRGAELRALRALGEDEMRDNGVAGVLGCMGASPLHRIQHDLIDPTQFYFHYKDHNAKMRGLAERIEPLLDKMLRDPVPGRPPEVVWWGANYDDMLTYPPYFEQEIRPGSARRPSAGRGGQARPVPHRRRERGLMDLIRDSGMHIAESFCPAPMTKVSLAEYYRRWSGRLTLFGGIPSTVVLPDTSEADFEAYMDQLFKRGGAGQAHRDRDRRQVPPKAVFSRLQRIGERIEREGRLPLAAGRIPPGGAARLRQQSPRRKRTERQADDTFAQVRLDVNKGKHRSTSSRTCRSCSIAACKRGRILEQGLIAAITWSAERMAAGEAFIPEVLLAARAMTAAVEVLEPQLAKSGETQRGKVLIGTVNGDMHDIGKNLVVTMLRGVGFEVRDLGINVRARHSASEVPSSSPTSWGSRRCSRRR